ncbi:MAG TPA: cation-translocating P-type ATPase C-terminal domain-containing protein [Chthoniobacterales bacterium]|nr:cation-translocating P-type ATPase C-terminal domain-containing protein [Chthoniobacterales bacterium]
MTTTTARPAKCIASRSVGSACLDLVRNPWLLGGLVLANVLQFAVVYIPQMNRVFHTVPISLTSFLLIGAAASLVLWVEEVRKFCARRKMQQ